MSGAPWNHTAHCGLQKSLAVCTETTFTVTCFEAPEMTYSDAPYVAEHVMLCNRSALLDEELP